MQNTMDTTTAADQVQHGRRKDIEAMTSRELWGKLWFSLNRADEVTLDWKVQAAQRHADAAWDELVRRGERLRLNFRDQREEMR